MWLLQSHIFSFQSITETFVMIIRFELSVGWPGGGGGGIWYPGGGWFRPNKVRHRSPARGVPATGQVLCQAHGSILDQLCSPRPSVCISIDMPVAGISSSCWTQERKSARAWTGRHKHQLNENRKLAPAGWTKLILVYLLFATCNWKLSRIIIVIIMAGVELETKVHPKVRNHGEGPYEGLLLVESAY